MKTFFRFLPILLPLPLLADISASYPPNVYEAQGSTAPGTAPMLTATLDEAAHWLGLMDQSAYAGAWQDAGPLFHDIISQDQWIAAMRTLRKPLGNVRTRKVSSHRATEVLPGGTRGYFMTIRYDSNFAGKTGVNESVVLMMIKNDQWRVISYTFK